MSKFSAVRQAAATSAAVLLLGAATAAAQVPTPDEHTMTTTQTIPTQTGIVVSENTAEAKLKKLPGKRVPPTVTLKRGMEPRPSL